MTMPPSATATRSENIIRAALRSFGQARTALRNGRVNEMIDELTRGSELLELIGQSKKRPARRRSTRRSQS